MYKIAVFVSGRGSNLKAIFDKVPKELAEICAVISDKKECGAIEFATQNFIPSFLVGSKEEKNICDYNQLIHKLKEIEINLVVLAGFLKKIPDNFIDTFENQIINIHPALLPCFGGEGMYGMKVHKTVFESTAKISGATVHFVDKIYDHGKIIAQRAVDISDVKSPEEIAQRVLQIEHELLPFVVWKFGEQKVVIKENRVVVL
jgi:formyltetrahydrofolate-dependent phosphoribosylglycinamide formyltransferase